MNIEFTIFEGEYRTFEDLHVKVRGDNIDFGLRHVNVQVFIEKKLMTRFTIEIDADSALKIEDQITESVIKNLEVLIQQKRDHIKASEEAEKLLLLANANGDIPDGATNFIRYELKQSRHKALEDIEIINRNVDQGNNNEN